ncbi:MAG TPA: DUF3375 domain-containing protein [Kineosporiaceae bacterium]|nr:DUF3375 domain-containing protein [Kineosporiaceae bacterium]
MQYDELEAMRRHHPAWRLLQAQHAPLILSFLGAVFIDENVRSISAFDLAIRLDDQLYHLNDQLGAGTFPRRAEAYLDDWAAPESGWLRKYYPAGSGVAHFDATADLEKAHTWVTSLRARAFVGTESRLATVFDLLEQMAHGGESDPEVRLADLEQRRRELDLQIERARAGHVDLLDATGLRDRYQQFTSTAHALLSDFREVEENFRALDRGLRERVATWNGSKGELLDDVLGSRSSIAESDQGRSFHAFYDFLLSQSRQEQFIELLNRVHAMPELAPVDARMSHVHYDWLEAGERTQATVRLLSEQLRRFLDDQVWLENRRVVELLHGIEAKALQLRDIGPVTLQVEMAATGPSIVLPMERPLYTAQEKAPIASAGVERDREEVDTSLLFEQIYVDPVPLGLAVRQMLQERDQIGLDELIEHRPLELGLAELVTYLSLEDPDFDVVFDETQRRTVTWVDADGVQRRARVPVVTFTRSGARAVASDRRWTL